MLRDIIVTVKIRFVMGPVPKWTKYERKLTYCKRFHLLHSKHGTGNKGKEREYRVSVLHATESTALFRSRAV